MTWLSYVQYYVKSKILTGLFEVSQKTRCPVFGYQNIVKFTKIYTKTYKKCDENKTENLEV